VSAAAHVALDALDCDDAHRALVVVRQPSRVNLQRPGGRGYWGGGVSRCTVSITNHVAVVTGAVD
jgi:hypothetical protein